MRLNRDMSSQANITDESELNATDKDFINLATVNGIRYLNRLPLRVFRKLLANHFDIRFKQKTVEWPTRVKNSPKIQLF